MSKYVNKYICDCEFCRETRRMAEEWDKHHPETNLQYRMVEVVKRLEYGLLKDVERNKKQNKKLKI